MTQINIDCRKIRSRVGAHRVFKEMLNFPDYYGMNLDALHDCLTETGELDITLEHADRLEKRLHEYGETILRMFEDSAMENPGIKVTISRD